MDTHPSSPVVPVYAVGNPSVEAFKEGQIILIDKPLWWTSFDVVRKIRNLLTRALGEKKLKVGHAGSLDPLATGLVIICTGKATKTIQQWMDTDKEYEAIFELGRTTPSFDLETETDAVFPTDHITPELVREILHSFIGQQMQIPPVFSAKNLQGKRAYELARKGMDVELNAHPVTIHSIELTDYSLPRVSVRIRCSKGTYIRSVARDFGSAIHSGACLAALRRTASGMFRVSDALSPEAFENSLKT